MSAPAPDQSMTHAEAEELLATIGYRADMTSPELHAAIFRTSRSDDQLEAFASALDILAAECAAQADLLGDYIAARRSLHG